MVFLVKLMPEMPQSEIGATIFSAGKKPGEKSGEILREILGELFVLCSLCRITPQKKKTFSPNSVQFITPCPANEMSKYYLRELLGLGGCHKTIGQTVSQFL